MTSNTVKAEHNFFRPHGLMLDTKTRVSPKKRRSRMKAVSHKDNRLRLQPTSSKTVVASDSNIATSNSNIQSPVAVEVSNTAASRGDFSVPVSAVSQGGFGVSKKNPLYTIYMEGNETKHRCAYFSPLEPERKPCGLLISRQDRQCHLSEIHGLAEK